MILDCEDDIITMLLEVAWRNPSNLMRAHLRDKEASSVYYRWAEQGRKIRARRANWDANRTWAT